MFKSVLYLSYVLCLVVLLEASMAYGLPQGPVFTIQKTLSNEVLKLNEISATLRPLSGVKKVILKIKSPYGLGQVQLQSGNVFSKLVRVEGTLESYYQKDKSTYHEVILENPNLWKSNRLILHFKGEHQIDQIELVWQNIPR